MNIFYVNLKHNFYLTHFIIIKYLKKQKNILLITVNNYFKNECFILNSIIVKNRNE